MPLRKQAGVVRVVRMTVAERTAKERGDSGEVGEAGKMGGGGLYVLHLPSVICSEVSRICIFGLTPSVFLSGRIIDE